MRWLLLTGLGVLMVIPWACGGKAVVDRDGSGAGGAGGAGGNIIPPDGPNGMTVSQMQSSIFVSTSTSPPPPICDLDSDNRACNDCAFDFCQFELSQCCAATGCIDLVACIVDECSDAQDQMACALAECPDEVAAGASSIEEAQALGDCISECGGCG